MPTFQQLERDEEEERRVFHGLTRTTWDELEEFIYNWYVEHGTWTTGKAVIKRIDVFTLMDTFAQRFDICAMYRYYRWARDHEEDPSAIMATIGHDLRGRNDVGFSPRTSSY